MKTVAPLPEDTESEPPFKPLTAEEAAQLRQQVRLVSPWKVVWMQVAIGALAALVAWAWTGRQNIAASVAYGALALALPAAIMARALSRGVAGAGVLLWELVKMGLSVALLVAAPRIVPDLHWLALLVGVILVTQVYWLALAGLRRTQRKES